MASMFGADATALRGPAGAGTDPIQAVRGVSTPDVVTPIAGFASGLIDSFGAHLRKTAKDEKPGAALVSNYIKDLTALEQQAQTAPDSITRRQVAVKTRQLYTKYAAEGAAYGEEYVTTLSKARTALFGGTSLGEAEEVQKAHVKRQDDQVDALIKNGWLPDSANQDLTQSERDNLLRFSTSINETKRIADEAISREDRQMKLQNFEQGATTWRQTQDDYRQTKQAQGALNGVISDGMGVLTDGFNRLRQEILPDGSNFAEVQSKFGVYASRFKAQGATLLQYDQKALSSFNAFMDDTFKQMAQSMDPKNQSEDMKAAFDRQIGARMLHLASTVDGVVDVASMSRIAPGALDTQIQNSRLASAVVQEINNNHQKGRMAAVSEGNTAVQKPTFKSIEKMVNDAVEGKLPDSAGVIADGAKQVRGVLRSIGDIAPGDQVSLAYATDFLASKANAELIKRGHYDAEAATRAIPVFEQTYIQGVAQQIKGFLGQTIGEATYTGGTRDANLTPTMLNTIRFKVEPDGKILAEQSRDPRMTFVGSSFYVASQVREAQKMADQLSTTVRATAHMLNRTDYEKVWEEFRHKFVPDAYPTPNEAAALRKYGWDGVGFMLNGASYDRSKGGIDGLVAEDR